MIHMREPTNGEGRDAGVVVREMKPADVDAVMKLERRIFSTPWTADVFRYELRRKRSAIYLVAEAGGRMLGYLGAAQMGAEVHVANIAVEPGQRRHGVGSALLLECVARGTARGARWLALEVRETNDGAREFYRRFGFNELGLRIGYYVDTGEHALAMATGDICSDDYQQLLRTIEDGLARRKAEG